MRVSPRLQAWVSLHKKRAALAAGKEMPVPSRNTRGSAIIAGQRTFFVTSSMQAREPLFEQEPAARLFIAVLYDYRRQNKYLLHEFVVMPNHFHALLTVDSSLSIERAVQFIKGGFAFRAGKELGLKPPIWQKGFSDARVWERDSYFARKDYIRNNPVRAGLVHSPEEYAFSSAHEGFEVDPPPSHLSG